MKSIKILATVLACLALAALAAFVLYSLAR